jgi:hypothetical protein
VSKAAFSILTIAGEFANLHWLALPALQKEVYERNL